MSGTTWADEGREGAGMAEGLAGEAAPAGPKRKDPQDACCGTGDGDGQALEVLER